MKCLSCGLTNFAADTTCRRCGISIDTAGPATDGSWQPMSTVQGWNSAAPAYDVPPAYGGGGTSGYGAYVPAPQLAGIWRDGEALVVHRNAVLPDRCVKCNAPAGGDRIRQRFGWHHPALYLLILGGVLIYAIVAIIVRKKAVLELGICAVHRKRRRMVTTIAWALLCAAVVAISVARMVDSGLLAFFAVVLFAASAFAGLRVSNWIVASTIDDSYVWLRKVDSSYLASFPHAR